MKNNSLAAIKMEVQRSVPPEPGFLDGIRELCNREGVVLIFDECTSGFRETFGGLHLKYGCMPDMAIYGKALGNGYAVTGVIGKREVMQAAQDTFISSTFWTERIGPSAAIKTLEVMEREASWEQVTLAGKRVRRGWQRLADSHGIQIEQNGLDALAGFSFTNNHLACKTLLTQEMLKRGYLAGTAFYGSCAHNEEIIDVYLGHVDEVFKMIGSCDSIESIEDLLEGPICHNGFKRLN